jgi:hypothetical protein
MRQSCLVPWRVTRRSCRFAAALCPELLGCNALQLRNGQIFHGSRVRCVGHDVSMKLPRKLLDIPGFTAQRLVCKH